MKAIEEAKKSKLTGRIFLSFTNDQSRQEILTLWNIWKEQESLPHKRGKWKNVFEQTHDIRYWNLKDDILAGDGIDMWGSWRDLTEPVASSPKNVVFQIELFYRRSSQTRKNNESNIRRLLEKIGGRTLSPFIDLEKIGFHAVKVSLPAGQIRTLLDARNDQHDIELFKFPGLMYVRPSGVLKYALGSSLTAH